MVASWPLIACTLCGVVACGTFGTQGLLALRGRGARVQMPGVLIVLACSVLAAVFACMRVGRLDRVFNVFGNPSSAIAQTFIAILVLVLASLAYVVSLRRGEEEGDVSLFMAVVAVLASLFGVYAIAAGDVATSLSAGKTALAVALVACAAACVGTLTCEALRVLRGAPGAGAGKGGGAEGGALGVAGVVCAALSGVAMIVFSFVAPTLGKRATSITSSSYGFESSHPTQAIADQVVAGAGATIAEPLFWVLVVAVGVAVPLVCAVAARGRTGGLAVALRVVAVACVLLGLAYVMDQFMFTTSATRIFS